MGTSDALFLTERFLSPVQRHDLFLEAVSITLLQFGASDRLQNQQKECLYPVLIVFDLPNTSQPRAQGLPLPS